MNLDNNPLFPKSFVKDPEVHSSAKGPQEMFLSLRNGLLTIKSDGTWEWSERPDRPVYNNPCAEIPLTKN